MAFERQSYVCFKQKVNMFQHINYYKIYKPGTTSNSTLQNYATFIECKIIYNAYITSVILTLIPDWMKIITMQKYTGIWSSLLWIYHRCMFLWTYIEEVKRVKHYFTKLLVNKLASLWFSARQLIFHHTI